jgi:ABC-type enterobactin transport system permease subunit
MDDEVVDLIQYLVEHPLYLAPILLLAATLIFAVIKKLAKVGIIVAIAGGLYLLLLRYFGPGF